MQQEDWRKYQERTVALENAGRRVREQQGAREVDIFSQGTRMSGTLWVPQAPAAQGEGGGGGQGKLLPGLVLCHGLGWIRSHLDAKYAPVFCKAGFVVLTFDYRGWSDSDGVLVPDSGASKEAGEMMRKLQESARDSERKEQTPVSGVVNCRVIRQPINMAWQVADVDAALSYLASLPFVDPARIGIWGTSGGGAHVLTCAGMDPRRVAAVVSQVPSLGKHGYGQVTSPTLLEKGDRIAMAEAQFGLQGTPQGSRFHHLPGIDGVPNLRSMQVYDPLVWVPKITAATLIIDMDHEELYDRSENGQAAFSLLGLVPKEKKKYVLMPGQHYNIYDNPMRTDAINLTIEFLNHTLKPPPQKSSKL